MCVYLKSEPSCNPYLQPQYIVKIVALSFSHKESSGKVFEGHIHVPSKLQLTVPHKAFLRICLHDTAYDWGNRMGRTGISPMQRSLVAFNYRHLPMPYPSSSLLWLPFIFNLVCVVRLTRHQKQQQLQQQQQDCCRKWYIQTKNKL